MPYIISYFSDAVSYPYVTTVLHWSVRLEPVVANAYADFERYAEVEGRPKFATSFFENVHLTQ